MAGEIRKITGVLRAASAIFTKYALGTASTDGFVAQNPTAATGSATVQISPRNRLSGTGWDADDSVSRTVSFFTEALPVSGNTVTGTWKLGFIAADGTTVTYPVTVTSGGTITNSGSVFAGNIVGSLARGYWEWTADGTVVHKNNAGSNTFTTTLADWGTTLGAESVSVAGDAALFLGAGSQQGWLFIDAYGDNDGAIYYFRGANALREVTDPATLFTVTKDNASTFNVYYDASGASGAGFYLQNKRATQNFKIVLVGG